MGERNCVICHKPLRATNKKDRHQACSGTGHLTRMLGPFLKKATQFENKAKQLEARATELQRQATQYRESAKKLRGLFDSVSQDPNSGVFRPTPMPVPRPR